MTARDFCYWLQGKLEIDAADIGCETNGKPLSSAQVEVIKKRLALVFAHDIDPQTDKGDKDIKTLLDEIHGSQPNYKDMIVRC